MREKRKELMWIEIKHDEKASIRQESVKDKENFP